MVTHNQKPCAYAAENRQLTSGWAMETWSQQGETAAGDSRIELILKEIALCRGKGTERGKHRHYSGKSLQHYKCGAERWEQ